MPTEDVYERAADGSVRLIGARCASCAAMTFPAQGTCPKCTQGGMERVRLGDTGILWSFTVQGFPPKAPPYFRAETPGAFEPYGVGYVELPGELIVECRLTESDPDRLRIGMPVHLTTVTLGEGVETYAFAPA